LKISKDFNTISEIHQSIVSQKPFILNKDKFKKIEILESETSPARPSIMNFKKSDFCDPFSERSS